MIKIHFKNVGQGDSIILEWTNDGKDFLGIIDCNIIDGVNPTLEFIKNKKDFTFEFIVLSHFHYDHFSGMSNIFQYCIDNKIKVKYFYHSLGSFLANFYNSIFTSKKIEKGISNFFEVYNVFDSNIEFKIPVHDFILPLSLDNKTTLTFHAPPGKIYDVMEQQLSRKVNKITTTAADVNKLATIISITNDSKFVLLTSDAIRKNFKKIRNKFTLEGELVQVPHHGSWGNIDDIFWKNLKKKLNCPAIFSVGDEPKDKLPNIDTVSFFDKNNFDIHSTNSVYGISAYFSLPSLPFNAKSVILNSFSKLRKSYSTTTPNKFNGDQVFTVL